MPRSVFFIMPESRSDSMKKILTISPELGSFNYFVIDPNQGPAVEHKDISEVDIRFGRICLYRRKFQIPAPRVWSEWEYLLHAPPRYIYSVWADATEFPEHWWAGPAELEVFRHRGKN